MLASRMAVCAILALACLSSSVVGFATPPNQAILNKLTNQKQLFADNNEQNPYGLAAVTFNKGKLVKGSFLATNWNDANGNPGQGHTILQISADGSASTFATIDPNNAKIQANCGNVGIGLTMALVILSKGYVIVGSTPIGLNANGIASPGCLILLDSNGNVLGTHAANEMTTSGTMTGGGPWGMAVQDNGVTANLFVSYVLGTNPASMTTLTGANGGMVVRYGLQLPGGNITPNFWSTKGPDVIASGFPTTPGGIGGGTVGPAGLAFATPVAGSQWNIHLQAQQLFISNLQNSSITVVKRAPECFVSAKAPVPCLNKPVAWGGLLNGNIGIQLSPFGTIVGANGGIGTLFEVAPVPFANTQLADQLVDNVNDNPTSIAGAGNLFNVLFHPQIPNKIIFNDDNFNAFFTLGLASGSRKML